jgi:hypothetical protein
MSGFEFTVHKRVAAQLALLIVGAAFGVPLADGMDHVTPGTHLADALGAVLVVLVVVEIVAAFALWVPVLAKEIG